MAVEDDSNLSYVFTINPFDLMRYVDQYVKITLKQGSDLFGTIYTIDPVSQSVILVSKGSESLLMNIVLNNSIKSIEVLPETPADQVNLKLNRLFNNNQSQDSYDNYSKKMQVKSWLLKNMVPVEEEGDILKIDTLEIHPPYRASNCYCNNPIVLDRILKLLSDMKSPQDASENS